MKGEPALLPLVYLEPLDPLFPLFQKIFDLGF
jgi:hypothetical protein